MPIYTSITQEGSLSQQLKKGDRGSSHENTRGCDRSAEKPC
jgi:hypothetical protein